MSIQITTRHPGSIEFLARNGITGTIIPHIDDAWVKTLTSQDRVVGPLPLMWVAKVIATGARYEAIDLPLKPEQRGKELTADEMQAAGAQIRRYIVTTLQQTQPQPGLQSPSSQSASGPRLSMPPLRIAAVGILSSMLFAIMLPIGQSIVSSVKELGGAIFTWAKSAIMGATTAQNPSLFDFSSWNLKTIAQYAALLIFGLAVGWFIRRLAGKILHASFGKTALSPKKIIIQGLSPVSQQAVDKRLIDKAFAVSLADMCLSKAELDALIETEKSKPDFEHNARAQYLMQFKQDFFTGAPLAWQQNFRSIAPHLPTLQAIYLLPPKLNNAQAVLNEFRALMHHLLAGAGYGHVQIMTSDVVALDYEDHDSVLAAMNRTIAMSIQQNKISEKDLIVDCTAGFKIFSIASAVATINRRILLSYVNTGGELQAYDGRIALVEELEN